MDIDIDTPPMGFSPETKPDYSILHIDAYSEDPKAHDKIVLIKETQLQSPIITHIYDHFVVNTNKRFQGLISSSINDEDDQYMGMPEEDSQMDVFSDDDNSIIADISGVTDEPENKTKKTKYYPYSDNESYYSEEEKPEGIVLEAVKVIVRLTSILVNDIQYSLSAPIRACCKVPGISDSCSREEDSLLVSLSSGFLLLVKFFLVPRSLTDSEYEKYGTEVSLSRKEMLVFKPFIVQWWDTSPKSSLLTLESSGHIVCAHESGLTAVSTSADGIFRIYNIQHTTSGIQFLPQRNVPIEGIVLHACLSQPPKPSAATDHVMFLLLVYTEHRRLYLYLYSWSVGDPATESLNKSVLPLQNSFDIPVHVIPLRTQEAFLFVYHGELVIVTPHTIVSADYKFRRVKFDTAFPTAFYKPELPLEDDSTGETVLISTDDGTIYWITISSIFDIKIVPLVKISDPISVFTFEKDNDGYMLRYGSDTGSNREVFIPNLFNDSQIKKANEGGKLPLSLYRVERDYRNWSPIIDVLIIDTQKQKNVSLHSSQEFWALTGTGKRTRITQLRQGYSAKRTVKAAEPFRNARLFHSGFQGEEVLCSYPNETQYFQTELPRSKLPVKEPFNWMIAHDVPTLLLFHYVDDDNLWFQITPNSIVLLESGIFDTLKLDLTIMLCDKFQDCLALLLQDSSNKFELQIYHMLEYDPDNLIPKVLDLIKKGDAVKIDFEPSLVKVLLIKNRLKIAVGDYDGNLYIYDVKKLEEIPKVIDLKTLPEATLDDHIEGFIPHDAVMFKGELIIGTKEGYCLHFAADSLSLLKYCRSTKVGNTPVMFRTVYKDENLLFILSRTVWLLNYYDSPSPRRVFFDEKTDKATLDLVQVPEKSLSNIIKVRVIREDGAFEGTISTTLLPNVKLANLGESAKKMLFIPHHNTFLVLCNSKNPKTRLKFFEKRLFKLLDIREFSSKGKLLTESETIFSKDEIPVCAAIWSIKRPDRVSKKILVGCTVGDVSGSFKVLDINKTRDNADEDIYVRVTELASFDLGGPIRCIEQLGKWILCCSGRTIYFTSYLPDDRKLEALRSLMSFPSDIVALNISENTINVTTKEDLIFSFKDISFEADIATLDFQERVSKDPIPKALVNQAPLSRYVVAGDKIRSSVLVMQKLNDSFQNNLSLRMPGIMRVYQADFRYFWNEETDISAAIGVSVSGEIVALRAISADSSEAEAYSKVTGSPTSTESLLRRLGRPFEGKLTGKCLRSINAPYFGLSPNNCNAVIDYDIEEISKVIHKSIGL